MYLTMNSARHQSLGMQNSQSTLHSVRTLRHFVPALLRNWGGGGIKTHSSVRVLVCLSIPLSEKNIFGMNDPWNKSFQLAPCRDLGVNLDILEGQFILPALGTTIIRICL